jgi:acetyl-CoA carboxylase biotin carboxyl carrier protein
MEFKQIQELIKAINKSNISELSVEEGDFKITIKQSNPETQFVAVQTSPLSSMQLPTMMPQAPQHMALPQSQPAPAAQATEKAIPAAATSDKGTAIKSPMIGTFYRSSSPDKPAFVNVGDEVKQGQVLCIIEAMKLFNEIESEVSGRIIKVLAEDASPVEYDQPLFLVEPI